MRRAGLQHPSHTPRDPRLEQSHPEKTTSYSTEKGCTVMNRLKGGFTFVLAAATAAWLAVGVVPVAHAADNQATGDVAGVDADLGNSNTFTLNSTTLALVKAAFLNDGTPLASGTTLARGTVVQFLIYIDNSTTVPVDSINVVDVLAAGFAYQAGSIKVDASQNTGATAAAIYAAVNATAPVTDAISGADVAGINAATISAGQSAGNAMLSIPATRVWSMLFTVKMQ